MVAEAVPSDDADWRAATRSEPLGAARGVLASLRPVQNTARETPSRGGGSVLTPAGG